MESILLTPRGLDDSVKHDKIEPAVSHSKSGGTMISVGLAGWGDHESLYGSVKSKHKLTVYSSHFPAVEVDSSFYAVQSTANYESWANRTPGDFQFVVKAYQGMTGHLRGKNPFPDRTAMFNGFKDSIMPLVRAGKCAAVLFQYPPWFDCTRENVAVLRDAKARMGDIPVALEFRNQSWFAGEMREKTIAFMEREDWIHSICDEPQAGQGSVPTVLHATDRKLAIVRMHGRNAAGWSQASSPNWREIRYLYRYSREELAEWTRNLMLLQEHTEHIIVIFNNNSGGDAADNAKELMRMLGQERASAAPEQLDLFD